MKHLTLSLLIFPIIISCNAQVGSPVRGEFASQSNGLMYSDTTMKALRHMVDSLNVRFRSCPPHTIYSSWPQGKLYTVSFASVTNDFKEIRKEMEHETDFHTFIAKHSKLIINIDTGSTGIKIFSISTEDEKGNVRFLVGTPGNGYDVDYRMSEGRGSQGSGKWIYNYDPRSKDDSINRLVCYYFPQGLSQKPIPQEYADYIAYVDCMIDTTAVVCEADTHSKWIEMRKLPGVEELNTYLNRKMKIKVSKKEDKYAYITETKSKYAIEQLKGDNQLKNLIASAADECIENNTGSDMLEDLVANFISGQKALEMKRHRRVVGQCSQDQSPRLHARNIAVLAAETNSWNIFLRAHMDIMNDRFERMSDGSYAYGGRKTYLKELEALNLNIVDLMIGLSLRAGNLAAHHYNGTVWRLGWALSESKDADLFETKAMQMMKDDRLDDFNRGLIFLLYKTYMYSVPDIKVTNEKVNLLKKDARAFPDFISTAINQLKERTARDEN